MFDVPFPVAALILGIIYALADRFAGGGAPKLDAKLPGRAAFWGGVLGAVAGYLLLGWPGAALAALWLVWRTPAWKLIKGGSATPRSLEECAATFVRHGLTIPCGLILAKAFELPLWPLPLAMAVFAFIATGLAHWYAGAVDHAVRYNGDPSGDNAMLELTRGGVFGALAGLALTAI